MSTLDFLFSPETKFLRGAGGCVEVWTTSCYPQIITLSDDAGFQIGINGVVFLNNCDMVDENVGG